MIFRKDYVENQGIVTQPDKLAKPPANLQVIEIDISKSIQFPSFNDDEVGKRRSRFGH